MDPLKPIAGTSPTPVFQGAEASSRDLRAAGDRLLQTLFPNTVLGDPARREKLGDSAVHVVEITAVLGAIQAFVPGVAGKVFGVLFSGLEKQPGTGKPIPTPGTAANFLPSPFGFLDPTAIGLKPNFYLPAGSTQVIPSIADRVGLGIPQQRAEDEANRRRREEQAAQQRDLKATNAVANESADTLNDILAGRGGLTRAGVIIATSETTLFALQQAARAELARRSSNPPPLQSVVNQIFAELGNPDPFPTGPAQPAAIPPAQPAAIPAVPSITNTDPPGDKAKRNGDGAKGIDRELIHERADP